MSCDEERRPVAEFMRKSIVFCSTCTMSLWKSSRSLSHLLMSFLSEATDTVAAKTQLVAYRTSTDRMPLKH